MVVFGVEGTGNRGLGGMEQGAGYVLTRWTSLKMIAAERGLLAML